MILNIHNPFLRSLRRFFAGLALVSLALVTSVHVSQGMDISAQTSTPSFAYSVDWSPDGSKIAVGIGTTPECGVDPDVYVVQILDAVTGQVVNTLRGSTCAVVGVDWSPDGTKVAAASYDSGEARLWDAASGQLLTTYYLDELAGTAVKWKPDGSALAIADFTGSVLIVNPTTGARLGSLHNGYVIDWSPDGSKLMIAGAGDNYVDVADVITGQRLMRLNGHTAPVLAVAWSPDGSKLASGGIDNAVRIWDAATGASLLTLVGHTDAVTSLAWSPDSTRLASGSADGTIRVWNVATGQQLSVIQGNSRVYAVDWSPDGNWLAYGGQGSDSAQIVPAPEITTPTPTPTATPTLRDNLITLLMAYGVHIEENGRAWDDTELQAIYDGVSKTAQAFLQTTTVGGDPYQIFKRVMIDGDTVNYIVLLRLEASTNTRPSNLDSSGTTFDVPPGYCKTYNGSPDPNFPYPRVIACRDLLLDNGNNGLATQYTIVHELGHVFDNRSNRPASDSSINSLSELMGLAGQVPPINDCTNKDLVLGQNLFYPDWRRGERGWGSGPAYRDRNAPTPVPLITNFQQDPLIDTTAKTDAEVQEAAADMFLNWVYRKIYSGGSSLYPDPCPPPPVDTSLQTTPTPTPIPTDCPNPIAGSGFLNESWSGMSSAAATPGTQDCTLPGDRRYWWMDQAINAIFTQHGW